jgi:hypothetical protein
MRSEKKPGRRLRAADRDPIIDRAYSLSLRVPPAQRRSVAAIVTTGVGVVLLIWIIWIAGPQQIWIGLRQVGWGLIAIIAIAGLRFAARATAWIQCLEPPHSLRFSDAFVAVVCGDALGNATPLGPLVSEPAKVAFVRNRVPLAAAFTALTIENVFYTLSVAAMIAAGITALLLRGGLERELRLVAEFGIVVVLAVFAAATWALASRVLPLKSLRQRLDHVRRLEHDIYTFTTRRRQSIGAIVATELMFHVLGVLEFYLTLWLLVGEPPSIASSFILETANRLITVLFKFVPMQQLGLNEAGTWLVAQALGIDPQIGFTLAIVKRARMLFWQFAGTALLLRHGITTGRILHDRELNEQRVHQLTTRSNGPAD